MPAIDRSLDAVAFISEHFRDILRRRFSELAGLALITLALLGAIALATWSVQDPSLSHATQTPIHNLLGFPGAIFADLAMQLLGLAAVMLLLPEVLLGWRLLSHRPVGDKWRGLSWILAAFFAAAFVSTWPHIGSWPLPTGLGGVFGDAMLRAPGLVFGRPLGPMALLISALLFGAATAVTVAFAAGIGWRRPSELAHEADEDTDDDESDGASAWLGMIAHALLSWKARAGRMLRRDEHALDLHRAPATALVLLVPHRHLRLPVGAQVRKDLRLAHLAQPLREPVREHDRQRHQLVRLVRGVAEHHPLVARADAVERIFVAVLLLERGVDALRDVGRLLVDGDDDAARVGVEAELRARVADLRHLAAHEPRNVDVRIGRDLARDDDEAGGDERLAGDAAVHVLGENRVEDGVRDLVGDLVRVALGDRLGGEGEGAFWHGRQASPHYSSVG